LLSIGLKSFVEFAIALVGIKKIQWNI